MDAAPFLSLAPGAVSPDACWWLTAGDDTRLRAALWRAQDPVGHVIYLTGRTEYAEKVAMPAADLLARGFSVATLDWRGQGLSDRPGPNPMMGHIRHFDQYQLDLDALLAAPDVAALPGPRLIVAHSMGGTIAMAALARPELATSTRAMILSAPMLGIAMSTPLSLVAWVTLRIAKLTGRLDRWPPFGDMSTPYALTGPDHNMLTADDEIWEWMVAVAHAYPELTLAMPSLRWFAAAEIAMAHAISLPPPPCPTLSLLGLDEQVVEGPVLEQWVSRTGTEIATIPDGRHELLIEGEPMRQQCWAAIDGFLARQGIGTHSG